MSCMHVREVSHAMPFEPRPHAWLAWPVGWPAWRPQVEPRGMHGGFPPTQPLTASPSPTDITQQARASCACCWSWLPAAATGRRGPAGPQILPRKLTAQGTRPSPQRRSGGLGPQTRSTAWASGASPSSRGSRPRSDSSQTRCGWPSTGYEGMHGCRGGGGCCVLCPLPQLARNLDPDAL